MEDVLKDHKQQQKVRGHKLFRVSLLLNLTRRIERRRFRNSSNRERQKKNYLRSKKNYSQQVVLNSNPQMHPNDTTNFDVLSFYLYSSICITTRCTYILLSAYSCRALLFNASSLRLGESLFHCVKALSPLDVIAGSPLCSMTNDAETVA